jgi:hypothetical protein
LCNGCGDLTEARVEVAPERAKRHRHRERNQHGEKRVLNEILAAIATRKSPKEGGHGTCIGWQNASLQRSPTHRAGLRIRQQLTSSDENDCVISRQRPAR